MRTVGCGNRIGVSRFNPANMRLTTAATITPGPASNLTLTPMPPQSVPAGLTPAAPIVQNPVGPVLQIVPGQTPVTPTIQVPAGQIVQMSPYGAMLPASNSNGGTTTTDSGGGGAYAPSAPSPGDSGYTIPWIPIILGTGALAGLIWFTTAKKKKK